MGGKKKNKKKNDKKIDQEEMVNRKDENQEGKEEEQKEDINENKDEEENNPEEEKDNGEKIEDNLINEEEKAKDKDEDSDLSEQELEIEEDFKNKKCSLKEHQENKAINFCLQCQIYNCNKCDSLHSQLFKNHNTYKLDQNLLNLFEGFCKNPKHNKLKLEYFCKEHNETCCAACLCKIKGKKNGRHKNCKVCFLENIKDSKHDILRTNISFLEKLPTQIDESIIELKKFFEKINKTKDEIKMEIQKLFTKIRTTINEREDELLLNVDNQFKELFFSEEFIKESEKLPNKIKESLNKGISINQDWNDDKLNYIINDCIKIEKSIIYINNIIKDLKKFNSYSGVNSSIVCTDNQKLSIYNVLPDMNKKINSFGFVKLKVYQLKFKDCPKNISEDKKYSLNETKNIVKKTGTDGWAGIGAESLHDISGIYEWTIQILNSKEQSNKIFVGVAPADFDIKSSTNKYGWYLDCSNSKLCSGPPQNYEEKETNLPKVKDKIIIRLDATNGTIKFIIDDENNKKDQVEGEPHYSNIPLDKRFIPVVFLYNSDDSVKISC